MTKKVFVMSPLVALLLIPAGVAATATRDHTKSDLESVGGSGVHGYACRAEGRC
jgi:hypothetical protein